MMEDSRRVVVVVREEFWGHAASGTVAARYDALGLTAYGTTEAEAAAALRKLFSADIGYYRSKGLLEQRLALLGAEWYWADEYPDDWPPYEDTDPAAAPAPARACPDAGGGDWFWPTQVLALAA